MTAYTAADASQPAIVRAALDAALVSGVARPALDFGPIYVRMTMSGYWVVIAPLLVETHYKTTEQAVAAIVAARNERK